MQLSQISIKRPVLASMMSLGLVLAGIVAVFDLPVREVPDIDPPIVTVSTVYPGANARVIETEVTERVEEAVNGIEGIKRITSESREQVSLVSVEFELSRDIDIAAQDVRDRVSRVRGQLPEDIDEPVIAKQEAEASPILWVALFSERYSTLELTDLAETVLKDPLQTVSGVSSVILGGSKRFAIRIRLDSLKMAAHGISILDVERSLREQNVELPSGRVENLDRELSIQTFGEMKTPAEFDRMVVLREGTKLVRLSDIGRAEIGVEDERALARYNSKPAMGLGIVKQSKANTVAVANGVKREVERLKSQLPQGVETFIAYDESIFVDKAIREVWYTLAIAFSFVVITIFVFLRSGRSTLIPALTIPVSLIATFSLLSLFGYSVNILTMLALVLAIGMVVDDSIVVLENIYRHIEAGEPPKVAASNAMKEISFAVVATTVALLAVFLPLAFQKSVTGRLFTEFAVTLCGAVVFSTFVALTLTPSVAAMILKPVTGGGTSQQGFVARWAQRYRRRLAWCLERRLLVVALTAVSILCSTFFYMRLDKEFLPDEDKGRLFNLAIAPEGSTAEYTDRMVKKMEEIMSEVPEVAGFFSAVALPIQAVGQANQGLMFVRFKEDRDRSVQDILAGPKGLQARFFTEVEGAIGLAILPKAIGRGFGQNFQLVLKDNDLDRLDEVTKQVVAKLQAAGFLGGVRSQFSFSKPELQVQIDRARANALGVSILDISRSMQILFGGLDLSTIKQEGEQYDVIVQLDRESRQQASDLEQVYVRNDQGALIQLSNLVTYRAAAGPNAIYHFNRGRSAIIEGTPLDGVPLGSAVEQAEAILAETLPLTASYEWAGEAADLADAGADTLFVVLLALAVIYIVLAAQFESLIHPVTVMVALPLAAFGAFGLLLLLAQVNILGTAMFGWANYAPDPPAIAGILSSIVPRIPSMTINLYSQIGLVLLLGLVTKNSILLVEFANQLIDQGKTAKEAMLEAAVIRFRPILMTAIGTITGILPIAIGFGAGAESRRPMGVVAIGGMVSATIFTFFVIPVVYTLFDEWFHRRNRSEDGRVSLEKENQLQNQGTKTRSIGASSIGVVLFVSMFMLSTLSVEATELTAESDALQASELDDEAEALEAESSKDSNGVSDAVDQRTPSLDERASPGSSENYDLRLDQAIAIALNHNSTIREAEEEIKRSSNLSDEIRSFIFPRVALLANYQETDDKLTENFSRNDMVNSQIDWNSRAEVRQPLFSGGKSSAAYSRQELLLQSAVFQLSEVTLEVLFTVRQRFFEVLLARSQLSVREESLRLLESELANERNKLAAGTVSDFNVLRAEVEVANARTPLIRAKNSIVVAKEELSRVLGVTPGQLRNSARSFEITGQLESKPYEIVLEDALIEAKRTRPLLRRLQANIEAAEQGIKVEQAEYFPALSAYGSWNVEKSRFSNSLDDTFEGWRAGVDLTWEIFSSFETRARVSQARNDMRKAEIALSQAELDVEVEVNRAYFSLMEARELLNASEKVVSQAEESLRLAQNRFSVGVGTQLEVLDSQVALTDARSNRVQALFDYQVSVARLNRVIGRDEVLTLEQL